MLRSLCSYRIGVARAAAFSPCNAQLLRKCVALPARPPCWQPLSVAPAPLSPWPHSSRTTSPAPSPHAARRLFASAGAVGDQQQQGAPGTGGKKRHILLPVDNSEDSDYAVSWALNHIYKAGDCLRLLHCIPRYRIQTAFSDGERGEPLTLDATSSVDLAIRQRHWTTLDAVRKRFEDKLVESNVPKEDLVYDIIEEQHAPDVAAANFFGVADIEPEYIPRAHASFETPKMIGDVIVELAEECDAAAVVMASHNKSPLAEFFLGSITNFCSHHCPKPVVILHNLPHPSKDDPKTDQGSGRAIAVAADDSAQSEKSLQWTIDNIYRQGDTVHIIHVLPRVSSNVAVADGFGVSFEEVNGSPAIVSQTVVSDKYREMLESASVVYEIDLIQELHTDSIKGLGSAIVNKAEELDASLLVMASHGKGVVQEFLLGSLTSFVTHHANEVPVVVLHP
mmetsp:Transcript_38582/g.109113  ORF Transcript_38582/g.109113 Transcript_38582/m.109113 type:complete len:451 (+) Transcript_38582:278-1630(+)